MEQWENEKRKRVIQEITKLGGRSEGQEAELILETFYDHNITPYLLNKSNQIIRGSRGMGKTHILRVLEKTLSQQVDPTIHCVFLDCRQVGSSITNGLNDSSASTSDLLNVPTRFFQYFLDQLYEKIKAYYNYQYYEDNPKLQSKVQKLVLDLKTSIFTSNRIVDSASETKRDNRDMVESSQNSGTISFFQNLNFSRYTERRREDNRLKETEENIRVIHSFVFPKFGIILEELLEITDTKLFLLLDEWSSIPWNIQPYFAEFLRKALFPIPRVKFKIAVVPQRTQFRSIINEQSIGLEVGADIQIGIDLDRTYSVDAAPEELIRFCYGFLCKHLSAMLRWEIEPSEFISNMFDTSRAVFLLVRAAEGNPRDFIYLTFMCVQTLLDNDPLVITESKITLNSKHLFETSKLDYCNKDAQELLNLLIRYVVFKNQNRGFLIDKDRLYQSKSLQNLVDMRIVHILKENYMDYKGALSKSCAILILDFGVYCDILQAGEKINFFSNNDLLERIIFPQKEVRPYQDVLLPYDEKRKFYLCYIDPVPDSDFTQYLF